MIRVTDTHSLVWFLSGDKRLSVPAKDALADPAAQIVVPTIVLAEVAFLQARSRITVDVAAILSYVDSVKNCTLYPLNRAIAQRLPTRLEMHDAIIVATAVLHQEKTGQPVALITRDQDITASGLVPVIW